MRSATSLIQTIGRAARNINGEVHMYADAITDAMRQAIDETDRRRAKQVAYNEANGIDPQPLRKKIADLTDDLMREEQDTAALIEAFNANKKKPGNANQGGGDRVRLDTKAMGRQQILDVILELDEQMKAAAAELQFELAARLRDEIGELKKDLRDYERHA